MDALGGLKFPAKLAVAVGFELEGELAAEAGFTPPADSEAGQGAHGGGRDAGQGDGPGNLSDGGIEEHDRGVARHRSQGDAP